MVSTFMAHEYRCCPVRNQARTLRWLVTRSQSRRSDAFYRRWLERAGIQVVWISAGRPVPSADSFDALVLTGGGDVAPEKYGAPSDGRVADVDRARDELEFALVDHFLRAGLPVFGVCRGIQVLNVFRGGRLIVHLPDCPPYACERHESRGMHAVRTEPGTMLHQALGPELMVNTSHHQAADPAAIGLGLRVSARSPAGVIEALEDPVARISAVQWHPERIEPYDHPAAAGLLRHWIEDFVFAARR